MNETYSNLLHESARKWNLSVPVDRQLIDDDTSPYPDLTVTETMEWRDSHHWQRAEITLVTLNGLWSYAANFSETSRGAGFGPFLKFCDPYQTRYEALTGAIAWLRRLKLGPELCAWADSLQPEQLSLF